MIKSHNNRHNPEVFIKKGNEFADVLSKHKSSVDLRWYPYNSISNIYHLHDLWPDKLLSDVLEGTAFNLLDIGAADGDMGFYMERLGCNVDFLDNPPTNYNGCLGLKTMKELLNSKCTIVHRNIDGYFDLDRDYDIVFALGLFYHLRNPMGFLDVISRHSKRLFLSTRVIRQTPDGINISDSQLAYLVKANESNNDATNYWMFTPSGLNLTLERTGWKVVNIKYVGCTDGTSNPSDPNKDERVFVYCEKP